MLRAEDVRANPRLNFVNDASLAAADRRAVEVQGEGGTLEELRLRHNMLSSMPMCFNIFGAIERTDGVTALMRELFDPAMTSIDRMICEVTPTRSLGDRTAFDAMIDYTTDSGPAFVGIETKYTEPFSQNPYDSDTYRTVTEASSWFVDGAADELVGSKTNQLWRGLMLASLVEEESGRMGRYVVVSTGDDVAALRSIESVKAVMTEPDRLTFASLETIVEAARELGGDLASWAAAFDQRYIPQD